MNILGYAPQMAAYGGMERHVCGLAAVLSQRGHRVTLMTTSNSLARPLRDPLLERGVEFRELARNRGAAARWQKLGWLLRETLRSRRTRWDVIYTNGQSGLARLPWFAAGSQTRIIHHHHTAADAAEQATWSGSFRRVLRAAPEIVACSRATQEALNVALRRADVRYLPYLTQSPVEAAAVREQTYSATATLHFGFTGRLVAEKGVDFICALSRLPELAHITWHVHGAGDAYPPSFFVSYPKIVYHGPYSSGPAQAAILQNLDAVVLFSTHNEGMPLSLIEAMSAGLPWIATDRGGTRELAISERNCLVVSHPATRETLTAAVLEMSDRIRRYRTSRSAQRRVYDQTFAPEVVGEQWCRYFENREIHPVVSRPDVDSPVLTHRG
jgi:glycosyltransferase involved in cell wall biosynthesis